jgi:hypothetical protein
MYDLAVIPCKPVWNKDKLIGQKLPLTVQQIYGIRVRLDFKQKLRDLALFNLGIDSKLRGTPFNKTISAHCKRMDQFNWPKLKSL